MCGGEPCIFTSELGIPGTQAGSPAQEMLGGSEKFENRHLSRDGRPPFQCSRGIKGNPVTHSAYYVVRSTCSVNRSCSEKIMIIISFARVSVASTSMKWAMNLGEKDPLILKIFNFFY